MTKLNERIKVLRKKAGLTQEELGEILGIQKASVQKYEKGTISNPKPEMVEKMAKVFNVTPSHIMGWDRFDEKTLSKEVKILEEIGRLFGMAGIEVFNLLLQMNEDGRRKVLFYAEDIKDKYERTNN